MGAGVTEEVEALLRLKACPGLGDRGISALVNTHGSAVAALKARGAQGQLFGVGVESPAASAWRGQGIRALPLTSPDYPSSLRELSDPPPLLFLKGREALLHGPAVAVVGARRATEGGRAVAEALGRVLGGAGITVVSGMARGIDGAAHRGALRVGGNTVGVLGSGLEVIYPPSHRGLFREMGNKGLLLSEFLPWEGALPHHFPKRNRIIAALARAIIVVEAGEKSGALITVDHGLDLGRDILAVPGSLQNLQARGTNALIRDGARLIPAPEAVLEELPELVRQGAAVRGKGPGSGAGEALPNESASPLEDALPRELRALWQVMGSEPWGVDVLAERAGLAPGEVLAGLSALELLGRATRCPGMRFRRE